ncbi:MAG: hypothetical protein ACYCVN_14415 [Acidimicrobiales bacterium]
MFREPPPTGYLHLAARIGGTIGPTPLPHRSARTRQVISRVKAIADDLAEDSDVTKATVYRAVLMPVPVRTARHLAPVLADYDVAVLIETEDVEANAGVRGSSGYKALLATLEESSSGGDVLEMPVRCVRLIADVDKDRPGLFLFNYFAAQDVEAALAVWEHMASWYANQTGLDNPTLLQPVDDAPHVFVNHARWDRSLASFAVAQIAKLSFRTEILGRLHTNQMAAMPFLYHLVQGDQQ